MSPKQYIKYNNKKVCLTDKDHFIEFDKHSGMVNTKFDFNRKESSSVDISV